MPISRVFDFSIFSGVAIGLGVGAATGMYLMKRAVEKAEQKYRIREEKKRKIDNNARVKERKPKKGVVIGQVFTVGGDKSKKKDVVVEVEMKRTEENFESRNSSTCTVPMAQIDGLDKNEAELDKMKTTEAKKSVDLELPLISDPREEIDYIKLGRAHEMDGNLMQALTDYTTMCILENYANKSNCELLEKLTKTLTMQKTLQFVRENSMALPSTFHIKRILKQFYNNPLTLDEICNTMNTVDTSGSENASNDPAYVVSGYGGVPCQKDKGNKRRSALTELMKGNIAPALNLDEFTVNGSAKYMTVKAIAAWQSDHLKESLLILDSIIFTDDMDPLLASFILIIKAKIQFLFKDFKDSVNTYEKAIKKCPSNTDIYVHRGMDYVVSFELELAMKDFHMAISLCINNTSAVVQNCALMIRLAKLNRRQNYMPEALRRFRNAVEKFPDDVNVQIGYAESLSFLGMYRKAGEVLSSALRLDSCNPWIYLAQGKLYQKRKEMEKSISCLHDNLKLDPSCVEAYYMLGCMEIERNNPEVGVSLYKKGIKFATCRAHVYKLTEMFLKAQTKIEIVRNHSK